MKTFYKLLGVTLIASTTNNYVWFALVFWAYLETKNVVSTSIVGGMFLVANALSSFWLGSIVDHHKKKNAMIGSSIFSLAMFAIGLLFYTFSPQGAFASVTSPYFWALGFFLLLGTVAGSIYIIAIPTSIRLIVPEDMRDKANGMFGMINGISFGITSVVSGLMLGYWGMYWVLLTAVGCTLIALFMWLFISVDERTIAPVEGQETQSKKVDLRGTIRAIKAVPGLFALIFFTTFNNFLGGVFMALMDAYGLTLVSVQTWGTIWGVLSFGFILGGVYISKYGLGSNPLRNLFLVNIIMWIDCILFAAQPSIWLLIIGMVVWMPLVPFVQASEQTIFQKVVPPERLGRVFGFAQSVEQAASPLTAFMIGPIAQYIFIPFMTTGAGVGLIGGWFGTGTGRGIALVFILAGIVGLTITLVAKNSRFAKILAEQYMK
jgi:DHA3 family multidrug efflux protein-like MFS transporter